MEQDLEELVARASDPRWIPAIYEYCDRRCARCRLNDRCFTFAERTRPDAPPEDADEAVAASLEHAVRLLHALAEREGIKPDEEPEEPEQGPEGSPEGSMDARMALVDDPLVAKAREYAFAAARLLQPLASSDGESAMSPEVREAVESIVWLCTPIASKVFRAVTSLEHPFTPADHPTQNDAHGSAKVARLMIGESLGAWRVINDAGRAPADSPTRAAAAALQRIDDDLAERIPQAMEFVRPGFDEQVPGTVRPWSLAANDQAGDRRLLAAEGIIAKLGAFAGRFLRR